MKYRALSSGIAIMALVIAGAAHADDLAAGFRTPPQDAKPRAWWHWMNGNISKEGIKLDLEWMHRIGLGGFQNFDASLSTPQVVDHRIAYMTPEWKDMFRYATSLANQMGLELTIASSPGWSETGGPWVTPDQAMKKLVWTETIVKGGSHVSVRLAQPSAIAGPFLDLPRSGDGLTHEIAAPPPYYRDSMVIAYRVAGPLALSVPRLKSSAVKGDLALLGDGDLKVPIFFENKDPVWVQFDYKGPQTVRSFTIGKPSGSGIIGGALDVTLTARQADGSYRAVSTISTAAPRTTASFPAVSSTSFRITIKPVPIKVEWLNPVPGASLGILGALMAAGPQPIGVSELGLSPEARVHAGEAKAGFATMKDYYEIASPATGSAGATPIADVVDLTGKMRPDGTLDWRAPAGTWRVLRMGQSLLGTTNHPATAEATGLEVDKLNAGFVEQYLRHYIDNYTQVVGRDNIGSAGVRAILTDSIEVDPQNWTDDILAEFRKRRGYDPARWLPALTGAVIGSGGESDKFLWDFRETLAELIADQHYRTVAKVAQEHGLKVYGESLEGTRQTLGDDQTMRKYADIPMAAMWTWGKNAPRPSLIADARGAASVGHVYGRPVIAAESLTSSLQPWTYSPRSLKSVVDFEFALGINRIVVHTSVHQPLIDKAPGLTLSIFGQYFNRNETWAEQAGPFVSYVSRSSYLLQQGRFAADVAYFYGQEAPLGSLKDAGLLDDAPTRYGFDFLGADAVMTQLAVKDGALVTPSGAKYRSLYLGGSSRRMTLPMLRKIAQLAEAGATVIGPPPENSPSLADDQAAFAKLAARLWGHDGQGSIVGAGKVVGKGKLEDVLAREGLAPDFDYSSDSGNAELMFVHRKLEDGELYFVSNRRDRAEKVETSFRVSGKEPEIWNADTGKSEPVAYRIENGRTFVPLDLQADDAVFVVFRKQASTNSRQIAVSREQDLLHVDQPWTVSFQKQRGAPERAEFASLTPWNESADPGIKYFSGTATYRTTVTLDRKTLNASGRKLLDLGNVRELAEVLINGKSVGIVWKPPFRFDLTDALQSGQNTIEVRVTNLWANRLIGDAQPGANKVAFTAEPAYEASAKLHEAGMMGPVRLISVKR